MGLCQVVDSWGRGSRSFSIRVVLLPSVNPLDNPCDVRLQIPDAFAFQFHDDFRYVGVPSLLGDDLHDLRFIIFSDLFEGIFPVPKD